jgi:hypothetical protein
MPVINAEFDAEVYIIPIVWLLNPIIWNNPKTSPAFRTAGLLSSSFLKNIAEKIQPDKEP